MAMPSFQSYTLPRKFMMKLRFLATNAINYHINLRPNHEFKVFDGDSQLQKIYITM